MMAFSLVKVNAALAKVKEKTTACPSDVMKIARAVGEVFGGAL